MSGIPGQLDSHSGELTAHKLPADGAYPYALAPRSREDLSAGLAVPGCMQNVISLKKHHLTPALVLSLFLFTFAQTGLAFVATGLVYVTDGSVSDVNAAISAAPAGATVQIPPGSFTWGTNGAGVYVTNAVRLIGSGTAQTTITIDPSYSSGYNSVINISAAATVGGFSIVSATNSVGAFYASGTDGWRITNVNYNAAGSAGVGYFCDSEGNYGLIDSSTITSGEGDCELIFGRGPSNSWQTPSSMGTANCMIIEDCTFNGPGYVCDANANARFVVRFCTITGKMKTDSHGLASNSPARGVRHTEWYNNTWTVNVSSESLMELRGGTGYVFNNTNAYNNVGYLTFNEYGCLDAWGNFGSIFMTPYNYPIKDQIGVGQDVLSGTNWVENTGGSAPVYSFNNSMYDTFNGGTTRWVPQTAGIPTGAINQYQNEMGNSNATFTMANVIAPDRDYFTQGSVQNGASYTLATFNGSSGVGVGTTAQMNAITPTLTGVGFWVTDQGSWNARLAANTSGQLYTWNGSAWVLTYTPYTYPDPARRPPAPTGLRVIGN